MSICEIDKYRAIIIIKLRAKARISFLARETIQTALFFN